MPGSEIPEKTYEKHWGTVMENQLPVHMVLERQGEPVNAQTWLCKEGLRYGVLSVLLYCAAFFGKLLDYYLQVQSLYFKKCFGKWRKSERAVSHAEYFTMRKFELCLTSPERQMKDSLTIQVLFTLTWSFSCRFPEQQTYQCCDHGNYR